METKLKFDLTVTDSPDRVWRALTDPATLALWLMPNDFAPVLGHRFTFRPETGKPIECMVVELRENERLAYWWDDGESGTPSLVVWNLSPTDGGTRLTLDHHLIEPTPVTALEAKQNWTRSLSLVPMVFMSIEEELNPDRPRIGLRREEVPA